MRITYFVFLVLFISCSKNMGSREFISDYNYVIQLPENWAEYDTEEKRTNAFFDTVRWTGNLRITSSIDNILSADKFFAEEIAENKVEKIKWTNIDGICYAEKSNGETIYFWELVKDHQLYICSFTLGEISKTR